MLAGLLQVWLTLEWVSSGCKWEGKGYIPIIQVYLAKVMYKLHSFERQ